MFKLFKKHSIIYRSLKLFKKNFHEKLGLKVEYIQHGYTLLEIFRQVDINVWFDIEIDNDIFFALLFLDNKPNNTLYYKNFRESSYFSKFEMYIVNGQETYFMRESLFNKELKDLEEIIKGLFSEIYEMNEYNDLGVIIGVK